MITSLKVALGGLALLVVLSDARPRPSTRCSLSGTPAARMSSGTYFVGVAILDTVHAGAGTTPLRTHRGPVGRARPPRLIYGQVVRVGKLGGAGANRVERAFRRRRNREVLVVPWGYDGGCETVVWEQSARWVPPGPPGFYMLQLRPESLWVSGRPVLDAFVANQEPYPLGRMFRLRYRATSAAESDSMLTPAEYFRFYAGLPTELQLQHDPAAASAQLTRLEQQYPTLARKYPARDILALARLLISQQ